jgi:RNA polymerase sigma factor (sigma-70 family)
MISRESIEESYDRFSREIFLYICGYVKNNETAEDLLHDVFLRLIRYSEKKSVDDRNIRALLYSISRTTSLDFLKSSAHKNEELADDVMLANLPDDRIHSDETELSGIIEEIIMSLPEPEKTVFLMKRNGLTFAEIAGGTGLSERTSKRKMKSVLEIIRKELEKMNLLPKGGISSEEDSLYE